MQNTAVEMVNFSQHSSQKMEIIYTLLSVYNLRISEILCLRFEDIRQGKILYVRGSKGSQDIVIREKALIGTIILACPGSSGFLFDGISYSKVYNWIEKYKSVDILTRSNKMNRAVTHSYRHANANIMQNEKEASAVLNHRTEKNQKYYFLKKESK